MISKSQIEAIATKIAATLEPLGHLSELEVDLVLRRAREIAMQRGADAEKTLLRLLRQ